MPPIIADHRAPLSPHAQQRLILQVETLGLSELHFRTGVPPYRIEAATRGENLTGAQRVSLQHVLEGASL